MGYGIKEMTDQEYHAHALPSWSTVRLVLDTPAEARHRLDSETTQTPAMLLGSLAHCAALEPDAVSERYHEMPDVRRGTKAWKAAAEEAPEGAALIKAGDMQTCRDRAACAREAMRACGLLARMVPELTEACVFGRIYDVDARCKPDFVVRDPASGELFVWDLKFLHDVKPGKLEATCERSGYYGQLASNARVLESALDGETVRPGGLVVVQTTGALQGAALRLTDEAAALGEAQARAAWSLWADCVATGEWPGYYPTTGGQLSVPAWLREDQ